MKKCFGGNIKNILENYNIDYRIIKHMDKNIILFVYPYKSFKETIIDAYYVASYAGYKLAKEIVAELIAEGAEAEVGRDLPLQKLVIESGLAYIRRKNGLTYNREYGSRFYIGAVTVGAGNSLKTGQENHCLSATDFSLAADQCPPKCNLCIKACPNDSISDSGVSYDKCLRHLANDPKTMTAVQIKMLGGRVLGCDICQRVCPFNKSQYTEMPKELAEICKDLSDADNITKLTGIVGKNMVKNISAILSLSEKGEIYRS